MKSISFEGIHQFVRSIRDFIAPIIVSKNIKDDLNEFLLEIDSKIDEKFKFYIQSGYRKYKYQETMYENADKESQKVMAPPGCSEHQTGLAIDFGLRKGSEDCDLASKDYINAVDILKKAGPNHGFILRYPPKKEIFTGFQYEPWHYTYVGSPIIAQEIMDNNLTIEEFYIANYIIYNNLTIN